jgi:uncharacterized membrane protein
MTTKLGVGLQGSNILPRVAAFESLIGMGVQVTRHYQTFSAPLVDSDVTGTIAQGRIPIIALESFDAGNVSYRWADVAAGVYDSQLITKAGELVSLGPTQTVYFAYHHEPEDDVDSINAQGHCGVASEFHLAWEHVRALFRAHGVGANVRIGVSLMSPTYRGGHGGAALWIPSSISPQWIGSDGYNRGAQDSPPRWRTFASLFDATNAFSVLRGVPMIVQEVGCVEGQPTAPGDKGTWFDQVTTALAGYADVAVFMYSNVIAVSHNSADYEVDTSTRSLARFKVLAAGITGGGGGPSGFPILAPVAHAAGSAPAPTVSGSSSSPSITILAPCATAIAASPTPGVLGVAPPATPSSVWVPTQLAGGPVLGGGPPEFAATGVNDAGIVCGGISDSAGGGATGQAVTWDPSTSIYTPLDFDGTDDFAVATAINASGDCCGFGWDSSDTSFGGLPTPHAYRWNGTAATILSPSGGDVGAKAHGINDSGQVVGDSYISGVSSALHAVVWNGTSPTVLNEHSGGGTYASAKDVNDATQVVGVAETATFDDSAALWDNSATLTDISGSGNEGQIVYAVNQFGVGVGHANPGGSPHAAIWTDVTNPASRSSLPTSFSLTPTYAYGVSRLGSVCGVDALGPYPVFWESSTTEPEQLLTIGEPFLAGEAYAISPSGRYIAGWSSDAFGSAQPTLWVRVPSGVGEVVPYLNIPRPFATTPGVAATVTIGGSSRRLNGAAPDAYMRGAKWTNIVNGGHDTASMVILASEYLANLDVYRYGAEMVLRVAEGFPDAGTILFTGYLNGPAVGADAATVTLSAVGYASLARDTKDPLLWQTWHAQDWQSTDDPPFGSYFRNDDSMTVHVAKAVISFHIPKGQDIQSGDSVRVGFFLGDDVNVTRVAGTLETNRSAPGGTDNYALHLYRYDAPTAPGSEQNVYNFDGEIGSPGGSHPFVARLNVGRNTVTFDLSRLGADATTGATWRLWFRDLRVNGDAYQDGRNPDDTYHAHFAATDIFELLGFYNVTDMVQATVQNCLPLFIQAGDPWSDTLDHLALILSGGHGWKWAVWDRDNAGNITAEFRDYDLAHNNGWQTTAYNPAAMSTAKIDQVVDDLYSKVIVTYHTTSKKRKHHAIEPVVPNPFADLDDPLINRQRARTIHIPEPLPHGATLPDEIATNLAAYYSEVQYGGTFETIAVSDGSASRWAGQVRAGELIGCNDFPNHDGTIGHTFRILQVDGTDEGPCTITIGRVPNTLARVMYRLHQRNREHALHAHHH